MLCLTCPFCRKNHAIWHVGHDACGNSVNYPANRTFMQELYSLREIIREKIQHDGPLTFRDFMEISLYHPQFGYYSSLRPRLGEDGDFYTSAYVTGLFGEL